MNKDTILLIYLTVVMVMLITFFINYKGVTEWVAQRDMNLSQRIHELNKMGIPYRKDCE